MTIGKDVVVGIFHDCLDTRAESLGFTPRRGAAWRATNGLHEFRIVWDTKMRDPLRGRSFTVEFENTEAPGRFATGLTGRVRLPQLLDPTQRTLVLDQQNAVVRRFERPTPDVVEAVPAFLREQYLSCFETTEMLTNHAFLSVVDEGSARDWGKLLCDLLASIIGRGRRLPARGMLLGQHFDWSEE